MRSWDVSRNVSLFLVGDPMQSIYRFRQADVSLFLRIWHQQIQLPVPVQPLTLHVNFRSEPAVVHWINQVFQHLLPAQADINLAAVPYSPATVRKTAASLQIASLQHGIQCETPHEVPRKVQHETVKFPAQVCCHAWRQEQQQQDCIADLLHTARAAQQTTAILVRSRQHLVTLLPYLEQQQIAYEAVELVTLGDQLFIRDIMQLLRVLHDPTDRLAWFCLLRCPWIGLTLRSLHYIAQLATQPWQALIQIATQPVAHQHNLQQPGIDSSAHQRIKLLHHTINQALQQRFIIPWSELLINTWQQLGGYLYLSGQQLQQIAQLLPLLEQHSTRMQLDITAITQHLQQMRIDQINTYNPHTVKNPDHSMEQGQKQELEPLVQVMTIHKAKGLEFDQVILPNIQLASGNADPELLLFTPCHFPDKKDPSLQRSTIGLLCALNQPVTYAGHQQNVYHYMRYREKLQQQQEQDRLLYVAATRAKRQLHLMAVLDKTDTISWKPTSGSFLAKLWPLLAEDFMRSCHHALQLKKSRRA